LALQKEDIGIYLTTTKQRFKVEFSICKYSSITKAIDIWDGIIKKHTPSHFYRKWPQQRIFDQINRKNGKSH